MGYSVELFLDERTEALIKAVWEKLASKGGENGRARLGKRPHVTLAAFDDVDPGEAAFQLRNLCKEQSSLEARFEAIGTFCSAEGSLFLVPVLTPKLFLLHATLIRAIGPMVQGLVDSSKSTRFIPHCNIAYGLDRDTLGRSVALFSNKALPIVGQFNRVGLYDRASEQDRCIYPFLKQSLFKIERI